MARKVNQALREEWRKRIERQRQSGLTVAEFCQREGVSTATFYCVEAEAADETVAANEEDAPSPEKGNSDGSSGGVIGHSVRCPVRATSTVGTGC